MNVLYYAFIVNVSSRYILCGVCVSKSTAISVDRLRYRHVVTFRRVRLVITCFWLLISSIGLLRVWRRDIAIKVGCVFVLLCLPTSIFCSLNIARYRKTVSGIMWVQMALVACYVPWIIVPVLDAVGIHHHVLDWKTALTLVYLNSSLNLILYLTAYKFLG